ncbi:MAG: tRNA (adenosine(37)-N6)-threonylcarbamoyltransferase complex ATPase subunit type 1 TsaE [Chloroflexota bacterium]|nr:tRNA (adenosine(37)-N6)-threonylcarbamoyltransferase complex ATPase subunit type 1 TsaE [Chloroflexota bacterium]
MGVDNSVEINSQSWKHTQQIGEMLAGLALPGDVFLLKGQFGVGKTCLTQGIARGLGIAGNVSSPSFVVLKEYKGRLPLFHIDLYRFDDLVQVADLGLDDYLFGRGLCVVEWAEKAMELLPPEHLLVKLQFAGVDRRRLSFRPSGSRYEEMLKQTCNWR